MKSCSKEQGGLAGVVVGKRSMTVHSSHSLNSGPRAVRNVPSAFPYNRPHQGLFYCPELVEHVVGMFGHPGLSE
jgi:hypothetical protein